MGTYSLSALIWARMKVSDGASKVSLKMRTLRISPRRGELRTFARPKMLDDAVVN